MAHTGEIVATELKTRRLGVKELATVLGISIQVTYDWLKKPVWPGDYIVKVSDWLGLECVYLLKGERSGAGAEDLRLLLEDLERVRRELLRVVDGGFIAPQGPDTGGDVSGKINNGLKGL